MQLGAETPPGAAPTVAYAFSGAAGDEGGGGEDKREGLLIARALCAMAEPCHTIGEWFGSAAWAAGLAKAWHMPHWAADGNSGLVSVPGSVGAPRATAGAQMHRAPPVRSMTARPNFVYRTWVEADTRIERDSSDAVDSRATRWADRSPRGGGAS